MLLQPDTACPTQAEKTAGYAVQSRPRRSIRHRSVNLEPIVQPGLPR